MIVDKCSVGKVIEGDADMHVSFFVISGDLLYLIDKQFIINNSHGSSAIFFGNIETSSSVLVIDDNLYTLHPIILTLEMYVSLQVALRMR